MRSQQHYPIQALKCPASKRREALLQLAAAYDPAQQAALSAAVKAMYNQPDERWAGLWVTFEAERLTGAIWVQTLPSNMAQLWLPKAAGKHAQALLEAAHQWVNAQHIRLCHVELAPDASETQALLRQYGMQRLVCLEYLNASCYRRLAMNEAMPLSLQPFGELSQAEQVNLLADVGEGSLDSRPLRDLLSIKELLAGFYRRAPQAPQHWYAVSFQNVVVGVLLLAPRPALGRWELMLMGLTPSWRGIGLGRSLLNTAMELAQQAGAPEMVLGVDDVNLPAKRLYEQAGFVCYARQRLLAWKGGGERGEEPK